MQPRQRKLSRSGKTKLDAHQLCYVEEPGVEEKLVLQLSVEIEQSKDANYLVVSWASQEEAVAVFNKLGFCDTLDYMLALRAECEKMNAEVTTSKNNQS